MRLGASVVAGLAGAAALCATGCKSGGSCSVELSGERGVDPDRDPVEVLDHYGGPSFSEVGDVEVAGDIVWFCTGVIGLQAYDMSDPSRLRKLDDLEFSAGSSRYPRCQHLAVHPDGDRVYVSDNASSISPTNFLSIVDASDPKRLEEIGTFIRDENLEGLTVHGDTLLVAAHESGLLLFRTGAGAFLDALDPVTEGLVNPWQVRVDDRDIAWVADGEGGLVGVDIANPASPEVLGRVDVPGAVKDLEIEGRTAYLGAGGAGVAVVSLDDPLAPELIEVEETPGSALGVALGRDALFVADWNDLRVFDRTDPRDLQPRAHEPLDLRPGVDSRTLGIAAEGDVLFSGNWTELVAYRHHPDIDGPDLTLSPRLATFGTVEPGETAELPLLLRNVGTSGLTVTGSASGTKALEVRDLPGTLAAGAEHLATLVFSPKARKPIEDWIEVESDDPDEPEQCVRVRANRGGLGVGDPAGDAAFVGIDGDTVFLSELEGSAVLLAYFATF